MYIAMAWTRFKNRWCKDSKRSYWRKTRRRGEGKEDIEVGG